MMYLEYQDESSNKFWQIEVKDNTHTVTFGKVGQSGQTKNKQFATSDECQKDAEKLIKSKKAKGYAESGQAVTLTTQDVAKTAKVSMNKDQILNEFRQIIFQADIQAILPFLQQYQQGNVSFLKDHLKKARLYWHDGKDFPNNLEFNPKHRLKRYSSDKQDFAIALFSLALLNLNDLGSSWNFVYYKIADIIQNKHYFHILSHLKPTWLTEYLRQQSNIYPYLSYKDLRLLEQQQLITFDPQLFSTSIANYSWEKMDDMTFYQRDLLTLFDYETNLFNYWYGENWKNRQFSWHDTLAKMIQEQKLERLFLIQKVLEIQTKNWQNQNKAAFRKILSLIEVTADEFLQLQDSLFLLLHSEYPTTVNFAIETIKPLICYDDFHFSEYLIWLSAVVPRTDLKTGIKAVFQQMTTALKCYPQYQEDILNLVTDALLQTDIELQERAAKILIKSLKPENETIIEKIRTYQDALGSTTVLLKPYLDEHHEQKQEYQTYKYHTPKIQYLKSENKIQLPQTWQDLLFLMGENIKLAHPLNFDLIMSTWLILKPQFPKDYQKQLKPIIKQMEKYTKNHFQSLFQQFFVTIFNTPEQAYDANASSHDFLRYRNNTFEKKFSYLIQYFAKLSYENIALPLLSLPTHTPSYIDPEILVKRLLDYQAQNVQFDMIDLAVALCRTPRENIEAAVKLLPQIQHPQLQQLLYFSFGKTELSPNFTPEQVAKDQDLSQQRYWWGLWDNVLNMYEPNRQQQNNSNFTVKLPDYKYNDQGSLHFDITLHQQVFTTVYNDFNRANFDYYFSGLDHIFYRHLTPLYQVTNDIAYLHHYANAMEGLGENMYKFFLYLSDDYYAINDYTLLILATHSFSPIKENRLAVTETLIKCFEQQKINLEILADYYAKLIYAVYAPFPRLLECFNQIKGSSELNNSALIQLIGFILKSTQYPEKLPTNFKKLFELYYELIYQYQIQLTPEIQDALQAWQIQFPTLKPIIQKILRQEV